jgi:hypothetical protein
MDPITAYGVAWISPYVIPISSGAFAHCMAEACGMPVLRLGDAGSSSVLCRVADGVRSNANQRLPEDFVLRAAPPWIA